MGTAVGRRSDGTEVPDWEANRSRVHNLFVFSSLFTFGLNFAAVLVLVTIRFSSSSKQREVVCMK